MDWYIVLLLINTLLFVVLPFSLYHPPFLEYWKMYTFVYAPIYLFFYCRVPKSQPWLRYNRFTQYLWESYFEISITDPHNTLNVARTQPIIFAVHPHGVYAASLFAYFGLHPDASHVTIACSSILFQTPILKEAVGALGCISVKDHDLRRELHERKRSVAMCPGGLRELLQNDGQVFKRWGFIKIAQETGASLVLVKSPAETQLYSLWIPKILFPIQSFMLRHFLYPFFIFSWGNPWCPFWPKKRALHLEFGPIVECPKEEHVLSIQRRLYSDDSPV